MSAVRILIAGIGNVFLGDDGFGVVVAERLRLRALPEGVAVIDFGIRGIDLAYALQDCDAAVLVDTVRRGGEPGTLFVLEPEPPVAGAALEMHAMTPDRVLGYIGSVPGPTTLRVVGCEPATFGPEGLGQVGLSPAVCAVVDEAVQIIEAMVREIVGRDSANA
jgi:hydrogenase maturation protease